MRKDSFLEFELDEAVDVGLTPLIDVVFQLLIFFMLTSSVTTSSLELSLPKLGSPESQPTQEALRVEIDADGQIAIDGVPAKGSFATALAEAGAVTRGSADGTSGAVLLYADEATSYRVLAEVMHELGRSGFTNIQFVYKGEQTGSPLQSREL